MSFSLQHSVSTANLPPVFDRVEFDKRPREDAGIGAVADLQPGQVYGRVYRGRHPVSSTRGGQRRLASMITDLKALREEERETEHPITDFAYSTAFAILSVAYSEIDEPIPMPAIAPDEEGGIRIEWARGQRNVRAVIPNNSTMRAYIYHRNDGESAIDRLSGVKLADRVKSVILEL